MPVGGSVSLTGTPDAKLSLLSLQDPAADTWTTVAESNIVDGFSVIETAAALGPGTHRVMIEMSPDVDAESINYVLVLGVNGLFDRIPNDSQDTAREIPSVWNGAFGHVGGTLVGYFTDYYETTTAPEAAIVQAGRGIS